MNVDPVAVVRRLLEVIERIQNDRRPKALLPGCLKSGPEDFVVEEIPAYEPCGSGGHLFLWLEKHDTSDEQLRAHLARTLRLSRRDIGIAGKKDRRAVTRQYVSVPSTAAERITAIDCDAIRVLHSMAHTRKLRTGHLIGNRFRILVRTSVHQSPQTGPAVRVRRPGGEDSEAHTAGPRDRVGSANSTSGEHVENSPVSGCDAEALHATGSGIQRFGFANHFGRQRFGYGGQTAVHGFQLLVGPSSEHRAPRQLDRRLALSAVQSLLFNLVLAYRASDGLLSTVLAGDFVQFVGSNSGYIVEQPVCEQPRIDCGEVVPTGPMFGPRMTRPAGLTRDREQGVLDAAGLEMEHFRKFPKLTRGGRRPLVVRPGEFRFAVEPEGIRFRFSLPAGSYATVLLNEFFDLKDASAGGDL